VNRPTYVRKRDGRVVPFDEGKIADAIYRAALAVGGEDRFLAEELASVVTLFLSKTLAATRPPLPRPETGPGPEVPTIEQVQDVVEKVLMETGHARTARAYILHRERRARFREAAAARRAEAPPTLFDDRILLVDDPAEERSAPFSAERLARTVAAEAGIDRPRAQELARGVEERLRRARMRRVPAPLLASLVDAELVDRALLPDPRARSGAYLPRAVIDAALAPKGRPGASVPPEEAARRLGGEALRAHALAEVFPPEVAAAHMEGAIHVHGLSRPAALFVAAVSLDLVKVDGVPGAEGRLPSAAAADPRRFLAQAGRTARALRGFVTHGLAFPAANALLAPLLPGGGREDGPAPGPSALREEAWHFLFETSGGPDGVPVEIDLLAALPPWLAALPARGVAGRRNGSTLADHASASLSFARALVAARASGDGLPPRVHLPALNIVVNRGALGDPRARELLREALAAARAGAPARFVLERDEAPLLGSSRARERVEEGARLSDPAALRSFCAQRVTLNLPRAAFRNPPGDLAGFLRECDRLVDLAMEAHRARRSLLATVAAGDAGALAPLFRRPRPAREGPPAADLSRSTWSVGVLGLNEAVAHLTGEELHESEAAARAASRILGYLALRVKEAGATADLPVALDATVSPRAEARLLLADRAEHRRDLEAVAGGRDAYSPGAACRPGAPVDLLRRLDFEGRLHAHLRTALFAYDPSAEEGVTEEGLLALLEKAFLHTPVVQLGVGDVA